MVEKIIVHNKKQNENTNIIPLVIHWTCMDTILKEQLKGYKDIELSFIINQNVMENTLEALQDDFQEQLEQHKKELNKKSTATERRSTQ